MKRLLLFAAIVYFFLAPITFHSDNKAVLQWVSRDYLKVWNIYDFTEKTFGDGFVYHYPPMHFVLDKLQWPVAALIGGSGYSTWLNKDTEVAIYDPALFRYTLATKTPLILVSILAGWLIYSLTLSQTRDEKRALMAAGLWFFNPVTLYSIPIMGQNDVFAVFFFLLGWRLINRHVVWATIFMGMSVAVKTYPLLWIVLLTASMNKWTIQKKMLVIIGSAAIYGLTILPFIGSSAFRDHALNAAIGDRFLIPQVNIGMEESIYLIPLLLIVLILYVTNLSSRTKNPLSNQAWYLLTGTITLFSFSHFHPQWFTALMPFWAIWISSLPSVKDIVRILAYSLCGFFVWFLIIVLFNDKFLSWGILTPLNPHLVNLPVLYEFMRNHGFRADTMVSMSHTILAALAVYLFFITNHIVLNGEIRQLALKRFALRFPFSLKIVALPAPVLLLITLLIGSALVPATVGVFPIASPVYIKPSASVQTTFTASYNNLKRVDFFMKNPGLKSTDTLLFRLTDGLGNPLYTLPFSAFNSGDESSVRFDFPLIPDSRNKQFGISLTKTAVGEAPLEYGMVNSQDGNSILFRHYYQPDLRPREVMQAVLSRFIKLVTQIPLWFAGIYGGFLYLVFRPTRKT